MVVIVQRVVFQTSTSRYRFHMLHHGDVVSIVNLQLVLIVSYNPADNLYGTPTHPVTTETPVVTQELCQKSANGLVFIAPYYRADNSSCIQRHLASTATSVTTVRLYLNSPCCLFESSQTSQLTIAILFKQIPLLLQHRLVLWRHINSYSTASFPSCNTIPLTLRILNQQIQLPLQHSLPSCRCINNPPTRSISFGHTFPMTLCIGKQFSRLVSH